MTHASGQAESGHMGVGSEIAALCKVLLQVRKPRLPCEQNVSQTAPIAREAKTLPLRFERCLSDHLPLISKRVANRSQGEAFSPQPVNNSRIVYGHSRWRNTPELNVASEGALRNRTRGSRHLQCWRQTDVVLPEMCISCSVRAPKMLVV